MLLDWQRVLTAAARASAAHQQLYQHLYLSAIAEQVGAGRVGPGRERHQSGIDSSRGKRENEPTQSCAIASVHKMELNNVMLTDSFAFAREARTRMGRSCSCLFW
jgi:hypothetical protein